MSLRKFDVFPKLENNFRVGTVLGGVLSLVSLTFTIVLSYVEIHSYLNPPVRQRLIVDSARPTGEDGVTISSESLPRLDSFINITFHNIPCHLLHFDVIDSISQMSIPLEHVKTKFVRVDRNNKVIGILPNNFFSKDMSKECQSCQVNSDGCCRTCQDVLDSFNSLRVLPPRLSEIPLCQKVYNEYQTMKDEGCRVESSFRVVRVGGEFHVAPGLSFMKNGYHVHNLESLGYLFNQINLSHTIHRLQFSNTEGKLPLDGFTNIQEKSESWKVMYTADILEGNFSASRFSMYNPVSSSPGVFFKYDVSPITAVTYLDQEPLLHLITRLLTVIGAVLGICRFIDSVYYSASKAKVQDKIDDEK